MHKYIGLTLAAALTLTGCQADNSQVIKVEYQLHRLRLLKKKRQLKRIGSWKTSIGYLLKNHVKMKSSIL